jgi:predicted branched-subunit amino acid permease
LDERARRGIVRDALGIGIATGAYALSFGAISTTAGLSILQTCALSLLMFTGASQFAMVGVIGAGGSAWAGAATAALLGTRNALYGLRLSSLLEVPGLRRLVASHFVIDETTAMAIARTDALSPSGGGQEGGVKQVTRDLAESRLAFWSTGLILFSLWNLGTLIGALATQVLPDPKALGFDAAPPAAFLALLAPRLRAAEPVVIALGAAAVALAFLPFVPSGVPLLIVAVLVVLIGLRPAR